VIEAWTDGACSQRNGTGHGPGGWAVVYADGSQASDGEPNTTNQRMELTAAIKALQHTDSPNVRIHSDSAYLINAMTEGWIERWISRNWRTAAKKAVANVDLWEQLIEEESKKEVVEWVKVKGHDGVSQNEMADRLAVMASRGVTS
jgi:ribonuclease HI